MSSGTQVDLDWAGTDAGQGGRERLRRARRILVRLASAYLTDEEILGIEPPSPESGYGGQGRQEEAHPPATRHSERSHRGLAPRRSEESLFDR